MAGYAGAYRNGMCGWSDGCSFCGKPEGLIGCIQCKEIRCSIKNGHWSDVKRANDEETSDYINTVCLHCYLWAIGEQNSRTDNFCNIL